MDYLVGQFKKGYKTTEFWLTLIGGAVVLLNGAFGWDLDAASITAMAGSVAAYVLGRSYLKGQRATAVSFAPPEPDAPEAEVLSLAPPVG
jgi:hypothetical protein